MSIINIDLTYKVSSFAKRIRNLKYKKEFGASIDEHPNHFKDQNEFGHWEIALGEKTTGERALLIRTGRMSWQKIYL